MTTSSRFDSLCLTIGLLILWSLLSLMVGSDVISSPAATLARVFELLNTATFWGHMAATGRTFLTACLIVLVGGLAVGLLIGSSRLASDVADPLLASVYSIPKIALYPVILLIFGLGPWATITFAAIHGLFPVVIFTVGGLRKVRPIYLRAARTMKLSKFQTIHSILIPAALPEIVAGLRIGFSTTLLGQIIAELFASTAGLGFMLIRATEAHRVVDIMAITTILLIAAVAINVALMRLEQYIRHA